MDGLNDGRTEGWTNGLKNERTDAEGRTEGRMYGLTDGRADSDGWTDGRTGGRGQTDGRSYGWTDNADIFRRGRRLQNSIYIAVS